MQTKPIVESLLFYSDHPEYMRESLRLARVINGTDRNWHAKEHPELRIHLSHFTRPSILVTIGLIISVFVITQNPNNKRVLDVVIIQGKHSVISEMSRTKLVLEASSSLNIKDYMPVASLKQIIWIPFKEKEHVQISSESVDEAILNSAYEPGVHPEAIVFTESIRGEWMLDIDISSPDPQYSTKTTQREILNNIVKEV